MKISNIFFGQRPFKNEKLYLNYSVEDVQSLTTDNELRWQSRDTVPESVPGGFFGVGTHGSGFQESEGINFTTNKTGVFKIRLKGQLTADDTEDFGVIYIKKTNAENAFGSNYLAEKRVNINGQTEKALNIEFDALALNRTDEFSFVISGGLSDPVRYSFLEMEIIEVDRNVRN